MYGIACAILICEPPVQFLTRRRTTSQKVSAPSSSLSSVTTRGASAQIDVLDAQTALTEAPGSFVDALRNYSVARASLLRATGVDLQWSSGSR